MGHPVSKIALLRAQESLWPAPILPIICRAEGQGVSISNSHGKDDLNFPLNQDLIQHDSKVWLLLDMLFLSLSIDSSTTYVRVQR